MKDNVEIAKEVIEEMDFDSDIDPYYGSYSYDKDLILNAMLVFLERVKIKEEGKEK